MHAAVQTTRSVVRNWRIRFMLASLLCAATAIADEVPADLVRRVAIRESETAQVQSNYTYRQSVSIEEVDKRGSTVGSYREVRDIIFSPKQERLAPRPALISTVIKHLRHLGRTLVVQRHEIPKLRERDKSAR